MIHHIYANQSNAGDWLSARGIQSLLAPLPVQEHFCDEPFVEGTLAALRETGPTDFIVIGGGGLFMDYFEPFWEGFLSVANRVPFYLWGVGCCDRKRQASALPQKLLKEIVNRSRLCVVRDELTRTQLAGCRLPPPVICPAANAVIATAATARGLLHVDHFDNVGSEIYERMAALSEAEARRTGRPHRQTNNLIPPGDGSALLRILELYAAADLVLTSRLHGCIIALAMGRRVLVVSGDHKVESFMDAAGMSDWVCDLEEIDSLPARLARLPEQTLPSAFIEAGRRQNRRVAETIRELAARERTT